MIQGVEKISSALCEVMRVHIVARDGVVALTRTINNDVSVYDITIAKHSPKQSPERCTPTGKFMHVIGGIQILQKKM